jgi:hypothetical protein
MNPIESLKVRLNYRIYLTILNAIDKEAYQYEQKKKRGTLSFFDRLQANDLTRPYYAYGMYHGAKQALACGESQITVIEFGVAGGNGLVAMESHAKSIEEELGVTIRIVGFDSGQGMPPPTDYRDLPYIWQEGFFGMDKEKLKARLSRAELRLGPVEQTINEFVNKTYIPPIAFIAFDLDYYSSTVSAFKLLDSSVENFLPRVFCYFDDCIGDDWEIHSEFTGELLAIKEFNEANVYRKIAPIANLRHKRKRPQPWNDVMYSFQIFDHPQFSSRKGKPNQWELELNN